MRNYDVIASRIDDIIAKGMPDPACDPQRTPLSPPLCADQLRALENIYDIPAVLKDGFTYNVGRWKGPEVHGRVNTNGLPGYLHDSMSRFDETFNPGGGA